MPVSLHNPADWQAALRVHARREYGERAALAVGIRSRDRMTPAEIAATLCGEMRTFRERDTNGQRATGHTGGLADRYGRRYGVDPADVASETIRRLTPTRRGRPADVLAWIALADRDPLAARAMEGAAAMRPVPRGTDGRRMLARITERAAANIRRDADRRPQPTDAAPDTAARSERPAALVAPDLWDAAWIAAGALAGPDASTATVRSVALAIYCATESATAGAGRADRTAGAIIAGAGERAGVSASSVPALAARGRTIIRAAGYGPMRDAWQAAVSELGQRDPANPDRPALAPLALAALAAVERLADTTAGPAPTAARPDGLRDAAPDTAATVRTIPASPNRAAAVLAWIAAADRQS